MPSAPPKKPSIALTSDQRARLGQVQTFLVNIADEAIGPKAARHGYDDEEHTFGWKHYCTAAGMARPFEHSLSRAVLSVTTAADSETTERFRVLDKFENKWFPRMRTTLRLYVVADQREAVEQAFFEDLSQRLIHWDLC